MKTFIISMTGASAMAVVVGMLLPEGKMKKYVGYIVSLILTFSLLSPLVQLVRAVSDDGFVNFGITAGTTLPSGISAGADSLISLSIARALCEKFGLELNELNVTCPDGIARICVARRFGLIASDLESFTYRKFGIKAEVIFIE